MKEEPRRPTANEVRDVAERLRELLRIAQDAGMASTAERLQAALDDLS